MGYNTEFRGQFYISPKLKPEHYDYLLAFSRTRRMKRHPHRLPLDDIREAAGLPAGDEGCYYVGGVGEDFFSQNALGTVADYNNPPSSQPGLWCQWIPNNKGDALIWDEGEKFDHYVEWLKYLIEHFLGPWGYRLNGRVEWRGEDFGDDGIIIVHNNRVNTT